MWDILKSNLFTPLNFLITVLAVILIVAGQSPINMLFFIAMVLNACIGIWQEAHARRILNRLKILNAPKVKIKRGSQKLTVDAKDILSGDIVELAAGEQVPADGIVVVSDELEVDESLLTGESDSIVKHKGDKVLSGAVVVAGGGKMCAERVGDDAYAAKLSEEAKKYHEASSELVMATNKILKFITIALIAIVPLTIWGQLKVPGIDWQSAVTRAVAAIIGMIPEGLVLLTSLSFMLSAVRLAKKNILVQQLAAVETLARVDTILLDKTGTLTDGKIKFQRLIKLAGNENIEDILATMNWAGRSSTERAIKSGLKNTKKIQSVATVPFNSQRKWSAMLTKNGCYYFGAPEILLNSSKNAKTLKLAEKEAARGGRVLALCKADGLAGRELPRELKPLALVMLAENIRPEAKKTLEYFRAQGVDIKIISGDSVETVAAVAKAVGLPARALDAGELNGKSERQMRRLIDSHNIIGRIQPEQKRLVVDTLKSRGQTVAMVGDGVNDIMAIKDADLGIAMRSGAAATRQAAEVVLMDNNFADLPMILAEGRRVVANIERVASLFLIKNVYSLVLVMATSIFGAPYPLLPAQMTVISSLTIGIPAFILSLPPNDQKYRPGFLKRVLTFSIPTGIITAIVMSLCYYFGHAAGFNSTESGTLVACVAMFMGLVDITIVSRPMKWWKALLIIALAAAFCAFLLIPPLAKLFRFALI